MMAILKIVAHIALFAVAIVIFTLGLGIGLQISPTAGSAMWIAAVLIALGNVAWIAWRLLRRYQS